MNVRVSKSFVAILVSVGISFPLCSCSSVVDNNTSSDVSITSSSGGDTSFDYYSSDLEEVSQLIDQNQIDLVKEKAKEVFVSGVDFIFYDGNISGVTFDELTEEGKEVTIDNLSSLGSMVDEVVPGWREELGERYRIASSFVNSIYLSGIDSIRGYLGDENYEALQNIKEQILGDVSNTYDNAKEHVKSWYEEFRSK